MAALALTASQAVAHPPAPDHGINESTFDVLWSGDDEANSTVSQSGSPMATLAAGTDIPFDAPPAVVEQWNRGDHREFPRSGPDESIHPPAATLHDGTYLKDAYVAIFRVQPSTRARLSTAAQPLYAAPNGSVLGTVDYRVAVPAANITPYREVHWSLATHGVLETRLLVDGQVVETVDSTKTPRVPYTEIGTGFGSTHALTLESEIAVSLHKRVQTCADYNTTLGCLAWNQSVERVEENRTVRARTDVVSYDLQISGYRARYPNGDVGLVVFTNQPWLGYSVPGGDVRGVWRFYTARDERWDTLVRSTEGGQTTTHSPLHPLQVHAFPSETGATASPQATVSIIETYGENATPPTLPEDVHLDALTAPYTASYGIATRTETTNDSLAGVEARGLVRGVNTRAVEEYFPEVPIRRSDLSLSLIERTDQTVTVEVRLVEAATGAPIATESREGSVVISGARVDTGVDGTARVTLERSPSGITARYDPGQWWRNIPGYTGSSDVVYVRGTVIQFVTALYELGVPVSLLLLGAFLIDRLTGWAIWPPWRWL